MNRYKITNFKQGIGVKEIIDKYGVSRSTAYDWIKKYQAHIDKQTGKQFTYREFVEQKKKIQELEQILAILKEAKCFDTAPRKIKLEAIERMHGKYPVKMMCRVLNVDTATFYNYHFRRVVKTQYAIRDDDLKQKIMEVFIQSDSRFGAKKITAKLQEQGERVTMKKISTLMKELSIQSRQRYKRNFVQTESKKPSLPHILQRKFQQENINVFWVGDITQIRIGSTFFYLCVIIDLFSRKVIAHRLSAQCNSNLAINTFKEAFENRGEPKHLSFHSDRGAPYISNEYRYLLEFCGAIQSCSKKANPYDNAVVESFFSNLKREELNSYVFKSFDELKAVIDGYMNFYNDYRPHESLKNKTPNQVESKLHNDREIGLSD